MVDKTRTIKNATDTELDEMLMRLEKERRVQSLIAELKRNGSKDYIPYDRPEISTEQPVEMLYHVGVLGMKWGARRAGKAAAKESMVKSRASGDSHKLGSFRRAVKDANKASHEAKKAYIKTVKEERRKTISKSAVIGKSIVVGLLASNIGSMGVYMLTGNDAAAKGAGAALGAFSGTKYYKNATK
jgi:hypothetical protein